MGTANGETESLSLFVTQSFLLCSAAYSGIIAALFVPHTGLLHPLSYTLTSINTLGNLSQIYTQENLIWVMREFFVKSLAVFFFNVCHLLVVATPLGWACLIRFFFFF